MTTPERAAELFYKNSLGYTQAVSLMIDMYGMTATQARDIIHATPCWDRVVNLNYSGPTGVNLGGGVTHHGNG